MSSSALLDVKDLRVEFSMPNHKVAAVDGVSLTLKPGETLGIVGESGSGKSVSAYALVGLLAKNGHVSGGEIRFDGRRILPGSAEQKRLRGREIAFIFQNPRSALNPIRSVGDQICDVFSANRGGRPALYKKEALGLLEAVQIARASERFSAYAHQLSGGMCQRVLMAMALAAEPRLLIADEPTTGLDVTTQKVVMDMVQELGRSRGLATILITHDLGLAAQYCQNISVMAKGRVVESGPSYDSLARPEFEYTRRLVAATPGASSRVEDLLPASERPAPLAEQWERTAKAGKNQAPLLEVSQLRKVFVMPSGNGLPAIWRKWSGFTATEQAGVAAVDGVSFKLRSGEALGIVGESGSGKTTTARMIARLIDHSDGRIVFSGNDIGQCSAADFVSSQFRRRIQVVFQDPLGSLNPRFTIYEAIRNPLRQCLGSISAEEERKKISAAAEKAGLPLELMTRYPHQLSGGQQARAGIARALVVEPELLILDEPTSALDVSVQAVVLNQLARLRKSSGIGIIFVSHDINVVRLLCDTVLVMKNGLIVESGDAQQVLTSPKHAYTQSLIDAVPHLPTVEAIPGQAESRAATSSR